MIYKHLARLIFEVSNALDIIEPPVFLILREDAPAWFRERGHLPQSIRWSALLALHLPPFMLRAAGGHYSTYPKGRDHPLHSISFYLRAGDRPIAEALLAEYRQLVSGNSMPPMLPIVYPQHHSRWDVNTLCSVDPTTYGVERIPFYPDYDTLAYPLWYDQQELLHILDEATADEHKIILLAQLREVRPDLSDKILRILPQLLQHTMSVPRNYENASTILRALPLDVARTALLHFDHDVLWTLLPEAPTPTFIAGLKWLVGAAATTQSAVLTRLGRAPTAQDLIACAASAGYPGMLSRLPLQYLQPLLADPVSAELLHASLARWIGITDLDELKSALLIESALRPRISSQMEFVPWESIYAEERERRQHNQNLRDSLLELAEQDPEVAILLAVLAQHYINKVVGTRSILAPSFVELVRDLPGADVIEALPAHFIPQL